MCNAPEQVGEVMGNKMDHLSLRLDPPADGKQGGRKHKNRTDI